MNKIAEVKKEVRHREWAAQIQECQNSGLPIKEWCKQNGINVYTYYRRLRKLREELLEPKDTGMPQIVPISISNDIANTARIKQKPEPGSIQMSDSKVVIRKDGIEIEVPYNNISEEMLLVLLKGLKQC